MNKDLSTAQLDSPILEQIGASTEETSIASVKSEKKKFFKFSFASLKKHINRRNMVILGSIALIGGAVYLNWLLFSGDTVQANTADDYTIDYTQKNLGESSLVSVQDNEAAASDGQNYLATVQINRQRARDEAMEVLQLVVDSKDALAEVKEDALQSMAQIAADVESEANIETLMNAKGFAECVAVINENTASIVVKTSGLMPNEVVQIKEIVCEQSGILPANIKIIEMK